MKHFLRNTAVALAGIAAVAAFAGCGGQATELKAPKSAEPLAYSVRSEENYRSYLETAENFARRIAPALLKESDETKNYAVSPVSIFMALSLCTECAAGETRAELTEALGASYEEIAEGTSALYRGLLAEKRDNNDKIVSKLSLSNSIWLQEGKSFSTSCLDSLSEKYFCHSYSADFEKKNAAANAAIRNFVKEQTDGLIDQDFRLPSATEFSLINTLYLRDIWHSLGQELLFTEKEYAFRRADGSEKSQKLLQGKYLSGRAFETDTFSQFYTSTRSGYELTFLVPKDGYTAKELFTTETLGRAASADYRAEDEAEKIRYVTRCLFPEFEAGYDDEIASVLREMGIETLFEKEKCDLTALSEDPLFCSTVRHVTKLKVNKKGIEGAAVTLAAADLAPLFPEEEWQTVYADFVVDRAFGFILTDPYGTTLFSGIVNR